MIKEKGGYFVGEVLYEVNYQFEPGIFIPLLMLLVIPFVPKLEKHRYGRTTPVGTKIFLSVIWCIVFAVTLLVGKHQFDMYKTVTEAYKSGKYQIVEGYVENFDPMPPEGHNTESFDIDGVHFFYSDYTVMTGYHNAKSKGGVITGDGQYLKIGYVHYGSSYGNVIVYIEALPEPQ